MPNRSAGYGHKCKECAYCFRSVNPGRRKGWCERPGQLFKQEIDPDGKACNVFKSK